MAIGDKKVKWIHKKRDLMENFFSEYFNIIFNILN